MVKHELRVTSCELRVKIWKPKSTSSNSNPGVTSSNPPVTSLNLRVTSSNPRVQESLNY